MNRQERRPGITYRREGEGARFMDQSLLQLLYIPPGKTDTPFPKKKLLQQQ